jgi:hypothetical protein
MIVPPTLTATLARISGGTGQFVTAFDEVFRSDGTTIVRTPPYTPVANASA